MWYVYLSLALQIFFGVHAVKTGRPFVWVLVITLFSVLGVLGYIIIELLPEWWTSRSGNKVKNVIGKTLDPEKSLKAAQQACELVDSIQNRINLAEQFMQHHRYQEARDLYARCLTGLSAEDPQIMLGLANAEFGVNNPQATINILEKLRVANPTFKSPDGHLLYARALENAGRVPEAMHEYEALNAYYPSPEPACRLAQIHQAQGNKSLAQDIFRAVIKRSATAGKHFNEVNKDWIKLAKREASESSAS